VVSNWRDDWLYNHVLREAEKMWEWCGQVPGREVWKYVLVEEFSEADDCMCGGDVVRAWVRGPEGLREISLEEHQQHQRQLEEHDPYPFVLFDFHVRSNRKGVVIGWVQGTLCGSGTGYLVEGEGAGATLVPDPAAGGWIS
jgi:hypothetical protein